MTADLPAEVPPLAGSVPAQPRASFPEARSDALGRGPLVPDGTAISGLPVAPLPVLQPPAQQQPVDALSACLVQREEPPVEPLAPQASCLREQLPVSRLQEPLRVLPVSRLV